MNMAPVTHSPHINETLLNSSYGNGKYRRPKALLSVSVPVGTELGSEIQTSLWLSLTMAPVSNSVFGTCSWAKQFPKWSSRRTAGTRGHGRGRTWVWSHAGIGRPCASETVPCAVKIVSYIPVVFVLRKHKHCICELTYNNRTQQVLSTQSYQWFCTNNWIFLARPEHGHFQALKWLFS